MLGKVAEKMGVRVVRFHKNFVDLTSLEGMKTAWRIVKDNPGAHIHASLPCTPWSRWQDMNLHKYGPKYRKLLFQRRQQSIVMLKNFSLLAEYIYYHGGHVSFEWPRYSIGWNLIPLQGLEMRLGMVRVALDGCMVGVKATTGEKIKKPWQITTTNMSLVNALKHRLCNKQHVHQECAGQETLRTGFYPQELCEIMSKAVPNWADSN